MWFEERRDGTGFDNGLTVQYLFCRWILQNLNTNNGDRPLFCTRGYI